MRSKLASFYFEIEISKKKQQKKQNVYIYYKWYGHHSIW